LIRLPWVRTRVGRILVWDVRSCARWGLGLLLHSRGRAALVLRGRRGVRLAIGRQSRRLRRCRCIRRVRLSIRLSISGRRPVLRLGILTLGRRTRRVLATRTGLALRCCRWLLRILGVARPGVRTWLLILEIAALLASLGLSRSFRTGSARIPRVHAVVFGLGSRPAIGPRLLGGVRGGFGLRRIAGLLPSLLVALRIRGVLTGRGGTARRVLLHL
jgi:hypothetical protein